FVYRQRGPAGLVQQAARRAGREPRGPRRDALEAALRLATGEPEPPFSTDGLVIPWNLKRIQADRAWTEHKALGAGVGVALLDSGTMPLAALGPALWRNPKEQQNGKDDDSNGYADDLFGWDFVTDSPCCVGDDGNSHGTMCAGIVAGRPAGEPKTLTGVA